MAGLLLYAAGADARLSGLICEGERSGKRSATICEGERSEKRNATICEGKRTCAGKRPDEWSAIAGQSPSKKPIIPVMRKESRRPGLNARSRGMRTVCLSPARKAGAGPISFHKA